jgi:hypothetical protein
MYPRQRSGACSRSHIVLGINDGQQIMVGTHSACPDQFDQKPSHHSVPIAFLRVRASLLSARASIIFLG